jgi:hypothetical protein
MSSMRCLALMIVLATGSVTVLVGCGGGAPVGTFACHNDNPPAGTPFIEGGGSCTLPNGRPGVGQGAYGCVDPNACKCKPEAGSAACRSGTCTYLSCNGVNEGESCVLPDQTVGTCCAGACRSASYFDHDPANCGSCGLSCGEGHTCAQGGCGQGCVGECGDCSNVSCAPGTTCVSTFCNTTVGPFPPVVAGANSCYGCVASDCTGAMEGLPCALEVPTLGLGAGICCNHLCVAPFSDDANCGGCGISCCGGAHCMPGLRGGEGVCF